MYVFPEVLSKDWLKIKCSSSHTSTIATNNSNHDQDIDDCTGNPPEVEVLPAIASSDGKNDEKNGNEQHENLYDNHDHDHENSSNIELSDEEIDMDGAHVRTSADGTNSNISSTYQLDSSPNTNCNKQLLETDATATATVQSLNRSNPLKRKSDAGGDHEYDNDRTSTHQDIHATSSSLAPTTSARDHEEKTSASIACTSSSRTETRVVANKKQKQTGTTSTEATSRTGSISNSRSTANQVDNSASHVQRRSKKIVSAAQGSGRQTTAATTSN